ncbi:MAG: AAA family ATPase, partial [Prevotellaceae bacterium]|nr:AAA family ATPase [Prevotellaceae bacterium]
MPIDKFIVDKLRHYLGHEPTGAQGALLHELAAFVANPEGNATFLLTGYAGTGKTTVIASLVKLLEEMDIASWLLAPTGRAAKVLAGYAGKSASTIHRKIYRQKTQNDPTSNFVLAPNDASDAIFIVDEASMISNENQGALFGSGKLLDDLLQFVFSGTRCKLLITGDPAQLPPVHSPFSPALRHSAYRQCDSANLTEVVRQAAESGILHNATRLRNHIENNHCAMPVMLCKGFTDIEPISAGEVSEKLSEAYERYGERETVVICRSNKRANIYNAGIRAQLLGRDDELVRGDRVMVVKNCYQFVEHTDKIDFIANGDIAELVSIRRHEERYGFHFARAELRFPDYDDTEITAKIMLDTLHAETAALDEEKQRQLYEAVAASYAHLTTKRDRYKAIREDLYYNALQLRYANAITCHKAQGGQWKAVFVDHGYLTDEMVNVEFLRWLYTAFTRATEQLYLVNFDKRF